MHAPHTVDLIEPDLLMLAYRTGIFPMADSREDPEIFWVEPRLRAILPLDGFRMSHSLARTLRRGRFTVTCNAAFSQVVEACAAPRPSSASDEEEGEEGRSWISHRIQASYENLHHLGHAHSIECWQDGLDGQRRLVGGLYGVGFERVFCGESMFSRVSDASKVALAWLVAAMRRGHASLLDCQFITTHLASLGAEEMSQKRYLTLLRAAQSPVAAGDGEAVLALPEAFAALLEDAAAAGLGAAPGKFIAQAFTHTS
ncbi:leucyl/phenylalanyl-tRNA--protein transferase [Novosphingobium mangrovi (ex Huang et al. 2023)]|uniref:Leucyl/phenylalanyl-tRNA--protein transferase n=1 Tax=Novosphingobium mangrovi (ex Huang et al. 2023) TaxID=2976432 RepID=A0ABT2I4N7_9SPHN|nr:leucyl/phenylalanyl-tRNA--protein transferase [Novosphingobium mangrovi (ex Huang et al. 2023)]MCT2399770.1 leucyl/phenylalanyl-tRNA--protein transferase [Novosphingobium mangrovi (ex Huang et al. 2023)]